MSYTKLASVSITARITEPQRKMLQAIMDEEDHTLSFILRDMLERERNRRRKAAESMVPPRRP